jgi:hypothetical protein
MSYTITLNQIPYLVLLQAADFVRKKYNMNNTQLLSKEFESEFNVKIHHNHAMLRFADDIEFANEADYLLFLLKWYQE